MRLFIKSKFRLQKKYIAFLTIFPLLMITAIVQVDCPVCHGCGTISGTPSMENVRIAEMESRARYVMRDACTDWVTYLYDVALSLENRSSDSAKGWIKLTLMDNRNDEIVDIRYLAVDLLGESTQKNLYIVYFGSDKYEYLRTEVLAEIVIGEVPDITCDGKGKVPLNTAFFINALKHTFQETVQTEQEYRPTPYHETEEAE